MQPRGKVQGSLEVVGNSRAYLALELKPMDPGEIASIEILVALLVAQIVNCPTVRHTHLLF